VLRASTRQKRQQADFVHQEAKCQITKSPHTLFKSADRFRCELRLVGCTDRLSPPDAEEDTAAAQEPQTADEADEREEGGCPQEGLEEALGTLGGIGLEHLC
jgi:hypothetical protein